MYRGVKIKPQSEMFGLVRTLQSKLEKYVPSIPYFFCLSRFIQLGKASKKNPDKLGLLAKPKVGRCPEGVKVPKPLLTGFLLLL